MIAHIVLFNPKTSVTQAQRVAFGQLIANVFGAVPAVSRVRVGKRIDVDPGYSRYLGDSAYEFSAVAEFEDKDSLVEYLNHPLHHELGRMFWETCESTVVIEVSCVDGKDAEAVLALVR